MNQVVKELKRWMAGALEMVYPATCEVCGRSLVDGESLLCTHCRFSLPRTRVNRLANSEIHAKLLAPGVPIDRIAAYFYYVRDDGYAKLIQRAKYNDRPAIARQLGAEFARELAAENFFDGIDLLQPIPLHWWKRFMRGYNQSEMICRGIAEETNLLIADNLRAGSHSTQTRKNVFERQQNILGVFSAVHPEELAGKHVLLVDDVLTTGATMLAAASTLIKADVGCRVSVLTLAATLR